MQVRRVHKQWRRSGMGGGRVRRVAGRTPSAEKDVSGEAGRRAGKGGEKKVRELERGHRGPGVNRAVRGPLPVSISTLDLPLASLCGTHVTCGQPPTDGGRTARLPGYTHTRRHRPHAPARLSRRHCCLPQKHLMDYTMGGTVCVRVVSFSCICILWCGSDMYGRNHNRGGGAMVQWPCAAYCSAGREIHPQIGRSM